ncbi:hypothetical protein [Rhodopirellula baltica]|uniref:Uncharacterized protein n=1 Tax=Rhodopirellula baltica SWK14 TaxID=993516 RepID=L7CCK9_RHOBT|nr:hypothetical protein [Rhodopirellula baltica]ELP30841.1 hypothetical protein RBSWK_05107 [Rhodopirellula baltica SWK14]
MTLYHYTTQKLYDEIEASGMIKVASGGIGAKELAVCWFTKSADWDETANKGLEVEHRGKDIRVTATRRLTHHMGRGLARIVCDDSVATCDWKTFKHRSGIKAKHASSLFRAAQNCGVKASDWRVSFEPIGREKWNKIEFWDGSDWIADRPHVERLTKEEMTEIVKDQINRGKYFIVP